MATKKSVPKTEKRKPASCYEATRDRPETLDELIPYTVDAMTRIYSLIRTMQATQDELKQTVQTIKADYRHTNERVTKCTASDKRNMVARKAFKRVRRLESDVAKFGVKLKALEGQAHYTGGSL